MAFSKDALPGLFRSLKPQPETPNAAALAAAHITQQKWPIFKSIKTTQVLTPPALSEAERLHWKSPDTPMPEVAELPASPATPAQSLANGLQAMVLPPIEQEADAPTRKTRRATRTVNLPATAPEESVTSIPVESAAEPPSRPDSDGTTPSRHAEESSTRPAAVREAAPIARDDDALAQVFERLRGNKKAPPAVERKTSAFLNRLGKR